MKRLAIAALLLGACAPEVSTMTESDASGSAGAAATQYIETGVGVAAEALTACTGAKTKVKARYNKPCTWSEGSTALTGLNCADGNDYRISNHTSTPPSGYARFAVQRKQSCPAGAPVCDSYHSYQNVQCSCNDASPCTTFSSFAAESDTGAGSGVGETSSVLATCSDSAYCSKARSTIASYLGGTWTWGSSCSSQSWQAQGSGGRTLVANKTSGTTNYAHAVFPSQAGVFYNICTCNSNGTVSCSNNPG